MAGIPINIDPSVVAPSPNTPDVFNVKLHGAIGNGVVDDTAAIQAAIDAAVSGDVIYLPRGLYKLTAALSITKSLTLRGAHCSPVMLPLSTLNVPVDGPGAAPWLNGSVLLQSTAATNGINLTASAITVHLESFGIRFADAIRHVDTGHGIYAVTATAYAGHTDSGILWSNWKDLCVFGHDGNHYAYYTLNAMSSNSQNLRGFGGGLLYQECDSGATNYGNSVHSGLYGNLYVRGTAMGIYLKGRAGGSSGYMNLLTLIRPQINVESRTASFAELGGLTPNLAVQKAFDCGTNVGQIAMISPDFEPASGSAPTVTFATGTQFITPEGFIGASNGGYTDLVRPGGVGVNRSMFSDGSWHLVGTAATVSAAAGAGTSPPAPVATNCGTYSGQITFGTGTGPAAGRMVRVAFPVFRGTGYSVFITPTNAATQPLGLYAEKDGNGFWIDAVTAPDASQANTIYSVDYQTRFDG